MHAASILCAECKMYTTNFSALASIVMLRYGQPVVMDQKDRWKFCVKLWIFLLLFAEVSAQMNMYMTKTEVAKSYG